MIIIPVIDLLDGQVVHALKGERASYAPIQSSLTNSSYPEAILNAYLDLYPFKTFYVADLNAIQKKGNNFAYINTLSLHFPDITFWLDAGIEDIIKQDSVYNHNFIQPVIGSENKPSVEILDRINYQHPDWILSLDKFDDEFIGVDDLFNSTQYWPKQVIMMMLNKVGTSSGIDIQALNRKPELHQKHQLYFAGGLANKSDLIKLSDNGYAGALIATALHNRRLDNDSITEIMEN